MSAWIKKIEAGYEVRTADGCKWVKDSCSSAVDFCRVLGFKIISMEGF